MVQALLLSMRCLLNTHQIKENCKLVDLEVVTRRKPVIVKDIMV